MKNIIRSANLADLSDERLVQQVKTGVHSLLKGNHTQTRLCAIEVHRRFKIAHRAKLPFVGFLYEDGNFNVFCEKKLDISARTIRQYVALGKEAAPPKPTPTGNEVAVAERLEKSLLSRGKNSWPPVIVRCQWAPWYPKAKSDKKAWPNGLRDRYKVSMYLTQSQVESLAWTAERTTK